ncbi:MAG: PEP-CTERM sorting domain-containing protein [Deltaproteobacteria bacterium]|nr:PEP-CTERM sorting domain-containing protein [Deltaproteobacteria bacterium]
MQLRGIAVLTALTAMLVGGGASPTQASTFSVTESYTDPVYGKYSGGTALWLPGIGSDYVFTTPGTFTTNGPGATLTGSVWSQSDPQEGFALNIQFSGLVQPGDPGYAPPDSPKRELTRRAYSEKGGPVKVNEWVYYTVFTGTLTGLGNYAGFEIDLVRVGPAFQMGYGANGKNLNFGGSGWFQVTASRAPQGQSPLQLTPGGHGDFNLDFENRIIVVDPPINIVPEPGSLVLFATGVVGLVALRRHKRREMH